MKRLGLAVAFACGLAGCSAYYSSYEFHPRPLEFGHVLEGGDDRAASVLVSVVGVRKADKELAIPASIELRLRLDNEADEPARIDPGSLRLFAANLVQFPPPELPGGALVVEPRGSGVMTAYFPFPEGKVPGPFDLAGLSVRWTLEIGAKRSTGSATFSLASDDGGYYEPGFHGWGGLGWGWGYSDYHHHHDHDGHGHGHGRGHGDGGGRGGTPQQHPGARMQSGAPARR